MKKNVMMRVASIMLVLVLMSSSVISGTFAKYVTSGESKDMARVAKWGVVITGQADMFKTEYDAKDNAATGLTGKSVVSADTIHGRNKLLAPGTEGKLTDIAMSGTPEVQVEVKFKSNFDIGGWMLNGTEYYCPIVIDIDGTEIYGMSYATEEAFEAAVNAAIESFTANYEANKNLAEVATNNAPTVSWNWAFHRDAEHDAKDTILGNQAAAGNPATIDLTVTCTITQID